MGRVRGDTRIAVPISGRDGNIGQAQPFSDQDHLAHSIALDSMADPLHEVACPEQYRRPPPLIPAPVRQLAGRQDQRRDGHRNTDDVQNQANGVLMLDSLSK